MYKLMYWADLRELHATNEFSLTKKTTRDNAFGKVLHEPLIQNFSEYKFVKYLFKTTTRSPSGRLIVTLSTDLLV